MKSWIASLLSMIIAGAAIYWLTTGLDRSRSPSRETGSSPQAAPSSAQKPKPIPSPKESKISELKIAITEPRNNSRVDIYDRISGTVSDKNAEVWIVLHPTQTPDCWVQTPVLVNSNGTWTASVQFGEQGPSQIGKPYEIRAFANPRSRLSPGRTTCWPKAVANSDALYVNRR